MSDRWVLNASPLICLARAGYHYLLKELPDEVVVPEAVVIEVSVGPPGDPAHSLLTGNLFPIVSVSESSAVLKWDLGVGETAVLSYVLENPGWQAIVDDRAARNCARALGISVKGTLSIILSARKRGMIQSAAEAFRALQASGLWLDDQLIHKVLQDFPGETW
jgi:predicted nucleic acid-binding protein